MSSFPACACPQHITWFRLFEKKIEKIEKKIWGVSLGVGADSHLADRRRQTDNQLIENERDVHSLTVDVDLVSERSVSVRCTESNA